MKTKCLFLFLLFQLHHCIGQEVEKEVPYFVMSCIEEFRYGEPYSWDQFPFYFKILFRLEDERLITIDTLNAVNDHNIIMNNILQCDDKKLFYFEESDKLSQDKRKYFTFFDYNNMFKFIRFGIDWDTNFIKIEAWPKTLIIDSSLIVDNETNTIHEHFGRDKNFQRINLPNNIYLNSYMEGKSGMDRSPEIYFNFRSIKKYNNKLVLSRDTSAIALYQLPDKYLNNKFIYSNIFSTKNYIIYQPIDFSITKDLDTCKIYIIEKKTNLCHAVDLPTNVPRVKNWQNWFYGSTNVPQPDTPKIISGKTYPEKYASRYDSKFGDAADLFLYTGQLFLYNFTTQELIKWNAGDPDSEIISISEGIIYYRVFDEIYTVKLDTFRNEIVWPTKKLLIKDSKRVPFIHWMFFAPKQDKVEEVWVNRPKGIKE